MQKQQIAIVHGGNVFDTYEEFLDFLHNLEVSIEYLKQSSWSDNLGEELGTGYDTFKLKMPNKMNAKYTEWKLYFDRYVPLLNNNVILIGHSLGGIFLAKYLAENDFPVNIRGLFLIAAPFDSTAKESVGDFALPADISNVANKVENIFIYQSTDDEDVPYEDAKRYQKALSDAEIVSFGDRGHFLQSSFPELAEKIKELSKN